VVDELFDKNVDYAEQRNIAAEAPQQLVGMGARFEPFLRAQEAARDPRPATNGADVEALRALGYVQ
jgi:hypothetical protein